MLTDNEREELVRNLIDYCGFEKTVAQVMTGAFATYRATVEEVGGIPLNLPDVPAQAAWLVGVCTASRWQLNPSVMELLLRFLTLTGRYPHLLVVLDRVRNRIDPNPDPFQTRWVLADQPFLNRAKLRSKIVALIDSINAPILRVNGSAKSGKSYTVELLEFIAEYGRKHVTVTRAKMPPETGPSYEAEELARELTLPMQTQDRLPLRTGSSYSKLLGEWIIRNAMINPGLWLFTLDGFDQPNIRPEVSDLIVYLAEKVSTPAYSRRLRLVLVDYKQKFADSVQAKTKDDSVLPEDLISLDELINCLNEFNKKMDDSGHPSRKIRSAEVPQVARQMLERAGRETCGQLKSLYDQLLAM